MKGLRGAVVAGSMLLAGCSIVQKVEPVETASVDRVCLKKNPDVLMEGFHPEVSRLIMAQGYPVVTTHDAAAQSCSHEVTYTANWRWDLAMYLAYARILVTEDGAPAGLAEYDARSGGANMGKFGTTTEKIEPLIQELFPLQETAPAT